MESYYLQIIQTLIVIVSTVIINRLTTMLLKRFSMFEISFVFQKKRLRLVNKIKNIILYVIAFVFILTIWSVGQNEVLFFVSSFITILGITLFAQWSLLSNITAGIILFVNHPTKIGDQIVILDKEFDIGGEIKDIGLFFIHIKTNEGEIITLPNSLILQKMIKVSSNTLPEKVEVR